MTAYMPQAKTIEWETPQDLFDELNAEFHFNLDVASTDENAKCVDHFTIKDDGLSQNWGGVQSMVQSALWQRNAEMDRQSRCRKG